MSPADATVSWGQAPNFRRLGVGAEPFAANPPNSMFSPDATDEKRSRDAPLRSVHTPSFPAILAECGSSLAVTSYQTGKLILLREADGVLNTHFRDLAKPMGLAVDGGRLAIGCRSFIWEFHDAGTGDRELVTRGEPAAVPLGAQSELFLPRRFDVTGDVQVHEMAWVGGELWFVNTAFSCLAVRSDHVSFETRWQPWFIDRLTPDDCCHLNGMGVCEGQVRYVTALAQSNERQGWRRHKRRGGIVIDVARNKIVADDLSMPHSPRWHREELWLLESGTGTIGRVDLATGRYDPVAELPGFTRGLCFSGDYAFVGVSQIRDTAVFGELPLHERLAPHERTCGVWIVHLETGTTAGFVRFSAAVQEIFAVDILLGRRCPDIVVGDDPRIDSMYVIQQQTSGA